ncbi:biotin carboxylase N-terminal domain-containing protein [Streptacidiphilus sp. EB129]|uniref:acetyl/propionyl/methylcrotonyl-CoA carboxylase subunit alpha n=1 Tax=Streptacidiphilus sp. EB129 TaxID=3156262 RepID=UPI00351509B0
MTDQHPAQPAELVERQITRLLVANRGEIARRIQRTCRDLGIETVAVFSDPDADTPHAAEADLAVRLPGAAPTDTYLRADAIIKAAIEAGADAVHPGYGFLSENADFARAVLDAGLAWVGPPPEAIEAMGSKVAAKRLMAKAGVPVLADLDPDRITAADLPVLVKASAGGGGRGMRAVHELDELAEALASARREAASAFGDATVFCEPLLVDARHIEVQIIADGHGTVRALGERECSIQRRHQKIVEECPSPAVGDELRARLCEAAVRAATAIGYTGAGTVEFLLDAADPAGRFVFLEVNTRLQVEHPVTECVYGLDLVRAQIEIAEGAALPAEPPVARGHAIEVRLYAETLQPDGDGAAQWRPHTGTLSRFEVPGTDAHFTVPRAYGLRLDSGVEAGSRVGVHYDPMLAKVIAWAPTRAAAARRLAAALAGARLHGVPTNRDLLVRILRDPDFRAGRAHTGFLDGAGADPGRLAGLAAPLAGPSAVRLSALAAALAASASAGADRPADRPANRPTLPAGWRNLRSQPQRRSFEGPQGRVEVGYLTTRHGVTAEGFDDVTVLSRRPDRVVLEQGGLRRTFEVARHDGASVTVDSPLGSVVLRALPALPEPQVRLAAGSLLAPMPGHVVWLGVAEGERVAAGSQLLVIEAMKMEHRITAPADGTVTALGVAVGDQVDAGSVLAVITSDTSKEQQQ